MSTSFVRYPAQGGGGSGMAIGDPVTGGTPTHVLFVDSSGNLAQSPGLKYDNTILYASNIGPVNAPSEYLALTYSSGDFLGRVTGALGFATDNAFDLGISIPTSDNLRPRYLVAGTAISVGGAYNSLPNCALDLRGGVAGSALAQFSNDVTGHASTDGAKIGLTSASFFEINMQETGTVGIKLGNGQYAAYMDDTSGIVATLQTYDVLSGIGNSNVLGGFQVGSGNSAISPYRRAFIGSDGLQIGRPSGTQGAPNYHLVHWQNTSATAVYSQYVINGTTGTTAADGTKVGLDAAGNFEIVNQSGGKISLSGGGVVLPNFTTTQKLALSATQGMVVFDTTLAKLCVYAGSAWETITSI